MGKDVGAKANGGMVSRVLWCSSAHQSLLVAPLHMP